VPAPSQIPPTASRDLIPSTLQHPGATRFWTAVMLTGAGTGVAAAALTRLLAVVQRFAWNGSVRTCWTLLSVPVHGGMFSCCWVPD